MLSLRFFNSRISPYHVYLFYLAHTNTYTSKYTHKHVCGAAAELFKLKFCSTVCGDSLFHTQLSMSEWQCIWCCVRATRCFSFTNLLQYNTTIWKTSQHHQLRSHLMLTAEWHRCLSVCVRAFYIKCVFVHSLAQEHTVQTDRAPNVYDWWKRQHHWLGQTVAQTTQHTILYYFSNTYYIVCV